jgi:hypothetical protein
MAITRVCSIIPLLVTFVLSGLAHAGPPIKVPEDHSTIQAAVDAANPGDKILIGPGVYNESIVVDVNDVRLVDGVGQPGGGADRKKRLIGRRRIYP